MQIATPLANAKIVIRPFEPSDADEFVRAAHESIETVGTWRSWCTHSFNRDKALGCVPKVVEKWPPHFIEPNSSKNTAFIYFKTT